MRYGTIAVLVGCAFAVPCRSQVVNYDDVAVIVNTNSPASVEIGAYFMAARNIPANRLITIDAPLTVSITPVVFAPLRAAIEAHLVGNDLVDSINYIVTTLGVPVRIDNGTCDLIDEFSKCASFDGEIALMLGPLSGNMVANGYVMNPFLNSTINHSRAVDGIFLVTRLAGPSTEDVITLIDRSGPDRPVDPTTALMVGDVNNTDTMPGVQEFWNALILEATGPASDLGLEVMTDVTDLLLDSLANVLGYVSLTFPVEPWLPSFEWAPGAMATEWYTYSALNYDTPGLLPGYNRVANWIARGATCAVGTVGITYASPWISTSNTYERYLDTSYHFNAAESMYAGIQWLSWVYDAIGDPKTSIAWAGPAGVNETLSSGELVLWPDPCDGHFTLHMPMDRLKSLRILDGLGREVPAQMRIVNGGYAIDLMDARAGMYIVKATTASGADVAGRIVLQP